MRTDPMVLVIDPQRPVVGKDVPLLKKIEKYRTTMDEIARKAIDHIDYSRSPTSAGTAPISTDRTDTA